MAAAADSRLTGALDYMRKTFSKTEFQTWNSKDITTKYRIGGVFPTALKSLGAIQTEYGKVKLTERIFTMRPSTVRKRMTQMVYDSMEKQTTPAPKTQTKPQNFEQVIVAIKKQVREEIISELLRHIK